MFDIRKERYRQRPETDLFAGNLRRRSQRMKAAATVILAVSAGIVVMAASAAEVPDGCGLACWHGVLQAMRNRY